MLPCNNWRDNNKTATGKEWANQRQPYFLLMIVLDGDKENISLGVDSGCVSLGVALSVLLKMERVVQHTRRAEKKTHFKDGKLYNTNLGE